MSIDAEVLDIVHDELRDEYGIPLRCKTTVARHCDMCGYMHESYDDIYGQHNGYRTHNVGQCIENLKERIVLLEQQVVECLRAMGERS